MIERMIVALGTFNLQAQENAGGARRQFFRRDIKRSVVQRRPGIAAVAGHQQLSHELIVSHIFNESLP